MASNTASSILVNVAEDAELRLVRLLASPSTPPSFISECEGCIVHNDAARLIRTIISEPGTISTLLMLDLDQALSAISLLGALLDRASSGDANASIKMLQELTTVIVNSASNNNDTSRQISLLSTLYNMRSNGMEKFTLLVKMFQLSAKTTAAASATAAAAAAAASSYSAGNSLTKLLEVPTDPSIAGKQLPIVTMLDQWQIPSSNRRELYFAAIQGASNPVTKQRLVLLCVGTYKAENELDDKGLEMAKAAAIGVIRDPVKLFVEQRAILTLPAIQALKKSPATAPLYELLSIIQEGKLEDYNTFITKHGNNLESWGVDSEKSIRTMRILSLCSLAAEHSEIPYPLIAETLQIETNQQAIETWVIAAVSSGLLSAKMDQLEQKVLVERCVVRKFDMVQWKQMQTKLHLWKENVGGILAAFTQAQQQQQQQLAATTTTVSN